MKRLLTLPLIALMLALTAAFPASAAVYHHWSETPAEVQAEHSPEVIQGWIDAYWTGEWVRLYWERIVAFSAAYEEAQRRAAELPPCTGPGHQKCSVQGIEVCNGSDLPTCGIVWRESRFNPTARNPRSSAGGLFQHLAAWTRTCGIPVSNMAHASVSDQVACARYVWNGGRNSNGLGPRHWRLTL